MKMVTEFKEGQRYGVNAPDLKQDGREVMFKSGKSPYQPKRINCPRVYHFWDAPVLSEWCILIQNKMEVKKADSSHD